MPVVGISPQVVTAVQGLVSQQKQDLEQRWANLGFICDHDRHVVTQSSKDIAYLTYHLQLPYDERGGVSLILSMLRNPVGTLLIRCPNCGGETTVKVPDPTRWNSDWGAYENKDVPCPSCDGHGWIPEKSA